MRLTELTYRGILGASSKRRLPFDAGTSRVRFPGRVDPGDVQSLIVTVLYPAECSDRERRVLQRASDPRVALTFTERGRTFRLVRGGGDGAVGLQGRSDGQFQTVRRGSGEVSTLLREQFGLPDPSTFRALHLWRWRDEASGERGSDGIPASIGPEAEEMVREYRQTLKLDQVDKELARVERAMDEIEEDFEEAFRVRDELETAREERAALEAPELSDKEYELLRDREERLEEYGAKLEELREEEREERRAIDELDPETPWREQTMWAGLGVGLLAMTLSFFYAGSLRWVALVNPVAFGVVAWSFLTYLTDREKVNIHKVRIESIERREAEVRREMVEFREKVDHILVHAGADSREELLRRKKRVRELQERVATLEERAEEYTRDPDFREARSKLEELREEHSALEKRREDLPDYGADIFQLENALHSLGIEPEDVQPGELGGREGADHRMPFEVLAEAARQVGCWGDGGLVEEARELWGAMASHVLGGKFAGVELEEGGGVGIDARATAAEFDGWLEAHDTERHLLAATLALAVYCQRGDADRFETVMVPDPVETFPKSAGRQLVEIFEGAPRGSHVVRIATGTAE